jgi:hypothetical protein
MFSEGRLQSVLLILQLLQRQKENRPCCSVWLCTFFGMMLAGSYMAFKQMAF